MGAYDQNRDGRIGHMHALDAEHPGGKCLVGEIVECQRTDLEFAPVQDGVALLAAAPLPGRGVAIERPDRIVGVQVDADPFDARIDDLVR